MKNGKVLATAFAATVLALSATTASALSYVNGSFAVQGATGWAPLPGPSISTATGIDFLGTQKWTVTSGQITGDFVGLLQDFEPLNTPVCAAAPNACIGSITDLPAGTFTAGDGNTTVVNIPGFWSIVDVNGDTFSFTLEKIVIDEQDTNSLTFFGFGTVSHPDFLDTYGRFDFSGQQTTSFSWSASQAFAAPEPASLGLLGLGLLGIGAARRRKTAG